MAEIAYLSFVQLTKGDKPYLEVISPKSKPRTRAAAVSEEGSFSLQGCVIFLKTFLIH